MRTSQYLLATQKEIPAEAEVISHKLMLRAGLVRKLASGLYTWLPTGLRVLNNVANIVRDEMNKAGAIEILMPVVQPADLWEESGRWEDYGPELLRVKDRHKRDFVLGPTHEEVITALVRNEVSSYKQLPLNLYQIQTKFRDEVRPRFGIMRGREFTMKDAYSFHLDDASLDDTYKKMYTAYENIFTRLGLEFRAVIADSGSIGGSTSHEFHVLADSGEDAIAFSDTSNYAANVEMASTCRLEKKDDASSEPVSIPVSEFENASEENKLTVYLARASEEAEHEWVTLVLRACHSLNDIKAEKLDGVASPLKLASDEKVKELMQCSASNLGPINAPYPVYYDHGVVSVSNLYCGANSDEQGFKGVTISNSESTVDIRNAEEGDASPDGNGKLVIKRGIEVGHIFQLGDKYSSAMNCGVLNETGKHQTLTMGCYGIGVSRIVAAAIEQNHDKYGIIWPEALAPFKVTIIPMNMHKSERIKEVAENLYNTLKAQGIDVLFDDRKERPGVMFADMELIGIPHSIVVGERNLDNKQVEYKHRKTGEKQLLDINEVVTFISSL